jgi:hypothetical protein
MTSTRTALRDALHIAFMIFMLACMLSVLVAISGCATTANSSPDRRPKGDFVMNIANAGDRSGLDLAGAAGLPRGTLEASG